MYIRKNLYMTTVKHIKQHIQKEKKSKVCNSSFFEVKCHDMTWHDLWPKMTFNVHFLFFTCWSTFLEVFWHLFQVSSAKTDGDIANYVIRYTQILIFSSNIQSHVTPKRNIRSVQKLDVFHFSIGPSNVPNFIKIGDGGVKSACNSREIRLYTITSQSLLDMKVPRW